MNLRSYSIRGWHRLGVLCSRWFQGWSAEYATDGNIENMYVSAIT